jgi:Tfp pilus assembly protein PilX
VTRSPVRRPVTASERGTVTVLVLGFLVLLGLLTVVVVDASAAYLRRQSVNGLADGAALAAADGAQGVTVYEHGLGERAPLDPAVARAAVHEYLLSTGARQTYPGLSWQVSATGTTVTVRLSAPLDLPLDPAGWAGTTTVVGTGSAAVVVG